MNGFRAAHRHDSWGEEAFVSFPNLSFSVLALHGSVPHLWDVCALVVFVDRVLLRIAQTGLELYIAQDRLKLAMILLPWPPKCWDYTHDA